MAVSLLGLGTVKLGRDQGVRYATQFAIPDDRSARDLLDCAQALGVNLLDTAPAYGRSEERLGSLLRGQRARWLLCSKVGEAFEQGRSRYDFRPEQVHHSVVRSLERLRTDYLDIVLIHSDGDDLAILDRLGTLEALQQLKQRGLIRALGISHKTEAGARRALALGCDVIMATLNSDEREQEAVIADAGRAGCGVLVKKALAGGHAPLDSLRYVAGCAGVSSIVVGTISPEHLRADATALCPPAPPEAPADGSR
ncbi:MAG: aldo/keto reductase [Pseudomonadales bacterium]